MGASIRGHFPGGKDYLKAMRVLQILRLRLRSLFYRARVEQELDEELRYHVERQMEDEIARGMTPADAAARISAGIEQRKEECRDMRKVSLFENLLQDLRFAQRQLRKNPGFAITAVLMLALGLAASVAIFAFVDAALLKPLPYANPNRLVGVFETNPQFPRSNLSYFDYLDWKKLSRVFVSLEAYRNTGFIMSTASGAQPARGARVSAGFFRALGVNPALGRDFRQGEDLEGAARTVILSDATWRNAYGAKADAIGKTVILDDQPYTIIGVLRRDFHFAPTSRAEYWATLDPTSSCERRRGCHNLFGVARLQDGVTVAAARADTVRIARQLEQQYPRSNLGQGAEVASLTDVVVGEIRPTLLLLSSGAALLLVIACVNIASLLLVRSESRRREMAVRSALGAGRARLFHQFVAEGLLLVAGGSLTGVALAVFGMRLLSRQVPPRIIFLRDVGMNAHVWAFAGVIAALAAVLFALTPTFRVSLTELHDGLAEGSRGAAGITWRRLGSKLVVVELAMAMVLLVGAGLLGRSLHRLLHVELGIQPDHLATLVFNLPNASALDAESATNRYRQIVSRIASLPGVKSAALASMLPVTGNGNTNWIRFVGNPYHGEHNEVNERDVSSDYFRTLGARLLRGRYFNDDEDTTKPGVVIINQTLAGKYFPGEDPVGKQIGDTDLTPKSLRTIIGVVADMRDGALDADIWPAEYTPLNQSTDRFLSVVARTSQAEETLLAQLPAAMHQVDRGIATQDTATMRERIEESPAAYLRRSSAWLVGIFAAVALLLGVVGLYGVTAYSVSRRTREIGVRMALGAQRRAVYALILKEAASLIAIGILAGSLGSLAASSLMRNLLFGVQSWDVPTLLAVGALLALAAVVASYMPARRAASVNPVEALRIE
jgi:macrolide transport system ATP-binding/permease protein